MIPSAHVFSHQQQYPQDAPSWMHQQQGHHHHAQQAAAAASAAQQHHYNRIAANHNNGLVSMNAGHAQDASGIDANVSEENRKTLRFIAELLQEDTREAALLELSKKREQVPELALILWHSFGASLVPLVPAWLANAYRRHDFAPAGDHLRLYPPESVPIDGRGIESRVQCSCAASVCSFSQ